MRRVFLNAKVRGGNAEVRRVLLLSAPLRLCVTPTKYLHHNIKTKNHAPRG
ncbi:hypothetical protein NSP_26970 [Nodularia spumigena CCY9414]|jgi:hypothetical protein|nr:hypothetical protein NSP_26970 [Nodularia spumigena CCY9414]